MDHLLRPRDSSLDSDDSANDLSQSLIGSKPRERSYSLQDSNHIPLLPANLFLESMGGASIYTVTGHGWVRHLGN